MEACSQCGEHRWFMERAWGVTEQMELYRIVCKKYGHGVGGWSWDEEEAIEHWNKVQHTLNAELTSS